MDVKTWEMYPDTLVFDLARQQNLFRLKGHVVLPVGAEIELPDRTDSARVINVRLTAGSSGGEALPCIVLDVEVPDLDHTSLHDAMKASMNER